MYFLKRLAFMIPLMIVISFLAFMLVRIAPGGPFDKERTPASPEIERALKAKYHLDQPVWKQFLIYLGDLSHGDFGPSLKYRNHTVNDIIAQGLPVSLTLGLLAFLFAQGVGIPIGFLTAVHRGKWQDYAGSFLALLA
ncbi:MAG TPA: ABC transporter permease, partial [Roseimicrobium sp.]|nr:ABC transporter permease [Roseimicrobium sp.]